RRARPPAGGASHRTRDPASPQQLRGLLHPGDADEPQPSRPAQCIRDVHRRPGFPGRGLPPLRSGHGGGGAGRRPPLPGGGAGRAERRARGRDRSPGGSLNANRRVPTMMGAMSRRMGGLLLVLAVGCAPAAQPVSTNLGPLDRSVMPEAGPTPEVDFPEIERRTLSNGLALWIVERPELPLVTMQLLLEAGAVTDPQGLDGRASLAAAMLTEGTSTRTATEIAEEVDFLAANLSAGAGRET